MIRTASARALLRPPLALRRYIATKPKESDFEASLDKNAATEERSTPEILSEESATPAANAPADETSQETEEKIRAYVASLTDIPIPLGAPTNTPPPTELDSPEVREAIAKSDAATPADTLDSSASGANTKDPEPSPLHSSDPLSSPSPSSDFASTHVPTQEDWEQKYAELRDAYNARMAALRDATQRKTKETLQAAAGAAAVIGLKVNEATGYREVERLKAAVKEREHEISTHRAEVRAAKRAYEEAVSTLSSTQSSVNSLLERKHSWSDSDVAKFTQLVRADHASRAAVTTTSEALKTAEINVDKSFTALMQAILERYHEEQVWSDKIRSVSTWAQIAALVANLVVFVGAIAFIEPWKRRRLVEGLEERVGGMMERVEGEIRVLSGSVGKLVEERGLERGVKGVGEGLPEGYVPAELAEVAVVEGAGGVSEVVGDEVVDDPAATGVIGVVSAQLDTSASSHKAEALHWLNTQLDHIAPPSLERDLTAAAAAGALGSALVIGLGVALRNLSR